MIFISMATGIKYPFCTKNDSITLKHKLNSCIKLSCECIDKLWFEVMCRSSLMRPKCMFSCIGNIFGD